METGTLTSAAAGPGPVGGLDPAFAVTADGHHNERAIVAHWLRANADKVRVLETDGPVGIALPADRIPTLGELCGSMATGTDPGDAVRGGRADGADGGGGGRACGSRWADGTVGDASGVVSGLPESAPGGSEAVQAT